MENNNRTKKQHRKLNDYFDSYLGQRLYTVAKATQLSETSKVRNLKKWFRRYSFTDITHSDLLDMITFMQKKKFAHKTINDHLTILRAVFDRATKDGVFTINPMKGVKNLKTAKNKPDPFNMAEIKKLTETPSRCEGSRIAILINILTGLRIGELLALAWEDIDWVKKVIHVRRAVVLGEYKMPKTQSSIRTVELNDVAIALLKNLQKITGNRRAKNISVLHSEEKRYKKEKLRFLFIDSTTKKPYLNTKQFDKFFRPFLKEAGVRYRSASKLRHTYASQGLTAGASKQWLASQMGHTTTAMIDRHYGAWIATDAPDQSATVGRHMQSAFNMNVYEKQNVPITPITPVANDELARKLEILASHPELMNVIDTLVRNIR